MRGFTALSLALLAPMTFADRLISVPIARKVPFESVRLDLTASEGDFHEVYLGLGVGTSFELDLRDERGLDLQDRGAIDFSYTYISPISGISPGLSFGVQDASNSTLDGRRFYLAVTSKEIYSTQQGDVSGDVTVGGFFGARSAPFVGLNMPMTKTFRLLIEHNGYRISTGFELRPTKEYALRLLVREHTPEIAITSQKHF